MQVFSCHVNVLETSLESFAADSPTHSKGEEYGAKRNSYSYHYRAELGFYC